MTSVSQSSTTRPPEAIVKREIFDAETNGVTTITLVNAVPNDREQVKVYRNGILIYEGAGNDYDLTGQVITLDDPIDNTVSQEIIQVLWVEQIGKYYRQHFDAETNGTTNITITENLGNLPTDSSFIRVYRNGVLQLEGAGNDYTVAGSDIVLDPAIDNTVAQEIVTVIFNI